MKAGVTAGGHPAGNRHGSGTPGRAGLAAAAPVAELATTGAGYLGYALVRLAIHVAARVKARLDTVTERVARPSSAVTRSR